MGNTIDPGWGILVTLDTLEFFPEEFIHSVVKNMKYYHRKFYQPYRFFFRLYNWATFQAYSILRKQTPPQSLSDNHIAFRMVSFIKMYNLLSKNSQPEISSG